MSRILTKEELTGIKGKLFGGGPCGPVPTPEIEKAIKKVMAQCFLKRRANENN